MKEITVTISELNLFEMHYIHKIQIEDDDFENVLAEFNSLSNDEDVIYEILNKYNSEEIGSRVRENLTTHPETILYSVEG
ncbi:hypothetical protein [Sulfurimonas xiamenensis]|uniref:Uncharacterized protein n=1 Tax=Sulfurimonas xiamenensis TaxID=2590021 RepID=A0AAJ4A2W7_9BACT|nr:hypothetical protein [Sulfurimonas xiamenensis]QFR42881.1 hypothetical protein FJR47_02730 [Sulfurimonas xiamenensis]